MSSKKRIIYIMGEGRSGSTILDLMLGNIPSIFGGGELWSFFEGDERYTGICTCGKSYQQCDFWKKVKMQFYDHHSERHLSALQKLRKKEEGYLKTLLRLMGFKIRINKDYKMSNIKLYEIISGISKSYTIIDSTKLIGRGFNLSHFNSIDTYVVHLIRDGRAVIWSRERDLIAKPDLKRKGFLSTTFAWCIKNMMAASLSKNNKRYILVKYEDLMKDPQKELLRIGRTCEINVNSVLDSLYSGIFATGHQIGGNIKARSKSRRIFLDPDNEWRKKLPRYKQEIFWYIGGRISRYFGYCK